VKPTPTAKVTNLPLLDPLKRFDFTPRRRYAKTFPRISIIGVTEPRPIPEIRPPEPGDPLDATRLCRRLHALKRALDDIDGQAKRLARWKARRDLRANSPPETGPDIADAPRLAARLPQAAVPRSRRHTARMPFAGVYAQRRDTS
jgi:hypothetical protein